jgi:hypothetical protein
LFHWFYFIILAWKLQVIFSLNLAETNKHYKHLSEIMKDFKNLHSTTPMIDKPQVKGPVSLNFIQKNEVSSKADSKNHIKTENNLRVSCISLLT